MEQSLALKTNFVPEEVLTRIALQDRALHFSTSILANPDFLRYASLLTEDKQIDAVIPHQPADFATLYKQSILKKEESLSELQQDLVRLIDQAYKLHASDIHIADMGDYGLIRLRIFGEMQDYRQISGQYAARLIAVAFNALGQQTDRSGFSAALRSDARIAARKWLPTDVHSIRLHSEPIEATDAERQGAVLAMRLLYDTTNATGTLEDRLRTLGFRDTGTIFVKQSWIPKTSQLAAMRMLAERSGLTLIAGPTGHGKSTVLRHLIESMVYEHPEHAFYSVEDPPEYPLLGVNQVQVSTASQGNSVSAQERAENYTQAIAGAMRSDPDVLMVGEIRYAEAAQAAMDAALTGHAVFASIHATDAFSIVTRLESMLRGSYTGSNPLDNICDPAILSGICCQRLLPILCPECKRPLSKMSPTEQLRNIPPELQTRIDKLFPPSSRISLRALPNTDCSFCHSKGFVGRTIVTEVVVLTPELLSLLRQRKRKQARELWSRSGGINYIEAAQDLVRKGIVDPIIAEATLGLPLDYELA